MAGMALFIALKTMSMEMVLLIVVVESPGFPGLFSVQIFNVTLQFFYPGNHFRDSHFVNAR
jgi:hypothetical protein